MICQKLTMTLVIHYKEVQFSFIVIEEISSLSRLDMVMVMVNAAMQSPVHSYFILRYCLLSIGRRGVGGEL